MALFTEVLGPARAARFLKGIRTVEDFYQALADLFNELLGCNMTAEDLAAAIKQQQGTCYNANGVWPAAWRLADAGPAGCVLPECMRACLHACLHACVPARLIWAQPVGLGLARCAAGRGHRQGPVLLDTYRLPPHPRAVHLQLPAPLTLPPLTPPHPTPPHPTPPTPPRHAVDKLNELKLYTANYPLPLTPEGCCAVNEQGIKVTAEQYSRKARKSNAAGIAAAAAAAGTAAADSTHAAAAERVATSQPRAGKRARLQADEGAGGSQQAAAAEDVVGASALVPAASVVAHLTLVQEGSHWPWPASIWDGIGVDDSNVASLFNEKPEA
jgi:hypothetical protein